MKKLKSNGKLTDRSGPDVDWKGIDTELSFPGIDTCVAVTCLVGTKLAGCHLYHYWMKTGQSTGDTPEFHQACLTEFAADVKKHGAVKSIYIIGNIEHWKDHMDELIASLKDKLGYQGPIGGSSNKTCTGTISAKLNGPVALEFTNEQGKIELAVLNS